MEDANEKIERNSILKEKRELLFLKIINQYYKILKLYLPLLKLRIDYILKGFEHWFS